MPDHLAPGIFVEESERGPKPIEGVSTSTAAFIGETERGPVKPSVITAYNEFRRYFGDVFAPDKYVPYALKAFFDNGGCRCYVARIVGANASQATFSDGGISVTAIGAGAWGNTLFVRIEPGSTRVRGKPIGFRLRVFYWDDPPSGFQPFDPVEDPERVPQPSPLSEDFDDISLDEANPDHWDKRINHHNSAYVTIQVALGSSLPIGLFARQLTSGSDGEIPVLADYQGSSNTDPPSGLNALTLDEYRDVSIVHAPNAADDVLKEVISHCERVRIRFAVVDSPLGVASVYSLNPRNDNDTKYAAFYYPWIVINDPRTNARKTIPPGGFVCGIYARSDNTRGVFKAPANELVAGTIDLEFDVNQGEQENLNPKGVNCIRRLPSRGIRVWGARTLSSDPLWKYVNVSRLLIFIEHSIYRGTQWVVFEPNDHRLWARIKQTVTLFLRTQWRVGALFGQKEEEAFSVAVGRETMTDDDIFNGRLIIEVAIAPLRPAEFVIFRVYQKMQEARS